MKLSRRNMMGGALAGAFCPWSWVSADDAPRRPNVVIIHTDEHNFRTLGCYRALLAKEQSRVWGEAAVLETPHVDALAARGALCDRFYAASPVCTPSRASFLTGRYPQNTGAPSNDMPLSDGMVTFGEVLRRVGYQTGYFGKWHLDGPSKPGWAPARAFGFEDNTYMFNRGHWKQFEDTAKGPAVKARNAKGEPTYAVDGADEKSFATDYLADKAVAFIQKHKDRPFCLMLSLPDPHGPNTVRAPYDTLYQQMTFKLPATAGGKGRLEDMARYFGMVKCIDDNVGKIMASLKAAGLEEKTIVVFTSDHGDMCGEHGLNNKGVPYEASAKIPFIIAYPGRIKPASVVREALDTTDFKPTLLGLLGLPQDARDEGRDASALLLNGWAPAGWRDVAFSRNCAGKWLMAVSGRYKFVVWRDRPPCFFDLVRDPLETRDLFFEPAARETMRELARELVGYAKRSNEPYAQTPAVQADMVWAAEGASAYVPPPRAAAKAGNKKDRGAAGEDEE